MVVRFSYDNFQTQTLVERKLLLLSIAELHFGLTITHLIVSVIWRRLLFMMFPVHQVLMMIKFTRVVGSSNWKSEKFIIIAVWTSYSPTDNSYSSLKHPFVIFVTKTVLLQQILFYTKNMFIYVCLYLFVPICHFTYITRSCLCMHITESHGGPETAISLI